MRRAFRSDIRPESASVEVDICALFELKIVKQIEHSWSLRAIIEVSENIIDSIAAHPTNAQR